MDHLAHNCTFILLLSIVLLSLILFTPRDAVAQYEPSSESKPGLSTEAVIVAGVLIGVAVVVAIVIANKIGGSEEEEVVPSDSTNASQLFCVETINAPWAANAGKEISVNTHSVKQHVDPQISLNRLICPVLILKREDFYVGLEVQF